MHQLSEHNINIGGR